MTEVRPLSPELLQRLADRLRADGAQPIEGACPGLSADEISELTAAFPGSVPAEARLWWCWRDWGQGRVLPSTQYASLQDAVKEYAFRRQESAIQASSTLSAGITQDRMWHPSWLPIFVIDGGMVLVVDVAQSDGNTAPIRLIDWQDLGDRHFARVVAGSLGDYISDMLDAIDAGEWAYDPALGDWRRVDAAG